MRAGGGRVEIENSVPGILPADLPYVFERSNGVDRTRPRQRRGGVGLAILRRLVDGFGGQMSAEPTAGRTLVWFELPAG